MEEIKQDKPKLELIDANSPPPSESQNITVEKLKKFMPKGTSSKVTEDIVKIIHNIENDTGVSQEYAEEQVMSCMGLLFSGSSPNASLINSMNSIAKLLGMYQSNSTSHTSSNLSTAIFILQLR